MNKYYVIYKTYYLFHLVGGYTYSKNTGSWSSVAVGTLSWTWMRRSNYFLCLNQHIVYISQALFMYQLLLTSNVYIIHSINGARVEVCEHKSVFEISV